MIEKIKKTADNIEEKITGYRRDFHKYPEVGWTEYRTSSIIARRLKKLGYEVLVAKDILKEEDRMGLPSKEVLISNWNRALEQGGDKEYLEKMKYGFTGAIGILKNGEGPTIALRFDIDALPINETRDENHYPNLEGFSSVNNGVMHSCGHDFHAAAGLGVAEILMKNKNKIKGTIKLIFQPAEEGVRGAKSIVTKGFLDDVQIVIGHHVSEYEVGKIESGLVGYKATKKFDVSIKGKPSHAGTNPQDGNNALLAASTAVLNLYSIARHKNGETRINVGELKAGTGRNIIPESAFMTIETRGSTSKINEYMYEKANKIINSSCKMYDCEYTIKSMGEALSGKSDEEMMDFVETTAKEIGEFELLKKHSSRGSEDFTYMMKKVQDNGGKAVYIGLGADFKGNGAHSYNFDLDEKALRKSMILLSTLVLKNQ